MGKVWLWAIALTVFPGIFYTLWLRTTPWSTPGITPKFASPPSSDRDVAEFVNLFIGTVNGGHVFPGATLPHGMVKAGMDTDSPGNHAGYDADPIYKATGFSQLHDDGTGGYPPLSNFKLWPLKECLDFEHCPTQLGNRSVLRALNSDGTPDDTSSPGYFSTNLSTGIRVELTATRRTALHRYTFPSPDRPDPNVDSRPRLIVDMTNDGRKLARNVILNVEPRSGRVTGGAKYQASFGEGTYDAFVCVDFTGAGYEIGQPIEYGTYAGADISQNSTSGKNEYQGEQGAIMTFSPSKTGLTVVIARAGVSLISSDQACSNAEEEIPDFDFETVHQQARARWNELLGRIDVEMDDSDREVAVLFYSSLYRSHIVPADYSGENPLWNSSAPYYDSLYCNWDTYRTLFPLMSLHDPLTYARIVQSFIDIQQHEGWLPECRGAAVQQYVQGGSNGDPIVAEFYIKFRSYVEKLGIDPEELYTALLQDAEVESPNWDFAGRQAEIWKAKGYLPVGLPTQGGKDTRQVSRTLEYSFDDFSISQVAKAMGKKADSAKYAKRSRGFELVWNPETTIENGEGILGFMQPRYKNGTFGYTDPRHCTVNDPKHRSCFGDSVTLDAFYEGGPIVYSQYVPHDTAKLIELQGGVEPFIRRLDFIFDNGYFDSTNEPSQQIPFMYHYANRPAQSTERARQTIYESFNTSINGLPGNDDSGAMGSYVAFYLLGLYPLPATRQFLVSSPYFSRVTIWNPLFSTYTTINANGFEGNPKNGTGGKIYVKSIRINGRRWKSNCFIDWDVFELGATVDLELTAEPDTKCGENDDALPPSLSTGGYD
ncbi:glycoside hydrolase family 92 protein [Rickenella mellea]|uniref:Glycoside hydrolase family 92 protein n=1 Tax=Rickenella mellea TaxID=50990 RepID=A0A4Y7Q7K9_9AGAM|nr:glycoside hydrolase family 92 protein [Rickenella mellea]